MDWQPIETAPKDETPILLWFPNAELHVIAAFWSDVSPPEGKLGGWYDSDGAGNPVTTWFDEPTHWMPMLEPPKAQRLH